MAQRNSKPDKSSPAYLAGKVKSGRHFLLIIVIFTIINLVILLWDQNTYLPFSASIPYHTALVVKAIENDYSTGTWVNGPATMRALLFSFAVLTVYFLCWLFSDKRRGWLIAALVLFIADTLAMFFIYYVFYHGHTSNFLALFFHIWAIVALIQAVRAKEKLEALPYPEAEALAETTTGPEF